MRMSCNGCRVLRKGCSENCSFRPCLQWIKSPESQAHATVFLAKFYGRAGLINLINAGPENLRPAIFRSLLYEACGRIVNPIFGSVGLLWSGSWQLCQAAVEAVLKGEPITPIASETADDGQVPPLKAYDIRHVSKDENSGGDGAKSRSRLKRSSAHGAVVRPKARRPRPAAAPARSASHESAVSQESDLGAPSNAESESMISEETAVCGGGAEPEPSARKEISLGSGEAVGLELALGFDAPVVRAVVPVKKRRFEMEECGWVEDRAGSSCKMGLGL